MVWNEQQTAQAKKWKVEDNDNDKFNVTTGPHINAKWENMGCVCSLLWRIESYAISKRMAREIPWMNELNKK